MKLGFLLTIQSSNTTLLDSLSHTQSMMNEYIYIYTYIYIYNYMSETNLLYNYLQSNWSQKPQI